MLAESEARRSRHLQELEGFRASREQVEAQLAAAEAQLSATQAALAQVCYATSTPLVYTMQCLMQGSCQHRPCTREKFAAPAAQPDVRSAQAAYGSCAPVFIDYRARVSMQQARLLCATC